MRAEYLNVAGLHGGVFEHGSYVTAGLSQCRTLGYPSISDTSGEQYKRTGERVHVLFKMKVEVIKVIGDTRAKLESRWSYCSRINLNVWLFISMATR